MIEDWREIIAFPEYLVSNRGDVINGEGRPLIRQPQLYGVPSVWLCRGNKTYCRSVPLLVARSWLLPPEREDFISPIQLDGNRTNCRVDNLLWRPRWFAISFHRERRDPPFPEWINKPIQIRETGEIFPNPSEIAQKYGVLETEVYLAITSGKSVFPQWFHYGLI